MKRDRPYGAGVANGRGTGPHKNYEREAQSEPSARKTSGFLASSAMPSSPLLSAGTSLALADEVAELFAGVHAEFGVDGADVDAHGVDGQ